MSDDETSSSIPLPQQRVAAVASAILRGELGIIEGARDLCSLQPLVSTLDHDPDFTLFIAIESETDNLPVGDVRQHWEPDALARKDKEIQEAEAFYRDDAFAGCQRLLVRFGFTSNDNARNA